MLSTGSKRRKSCSCQYVFWDVQADMKGKRALFLITKGTLVHIELRGIQREKETGSRSVPYEGAGYKKNASPPRRIDNKGFYHLWDQARKIKTACPSAKFGAERITLQK